MDNGASLEEEEVMTDTKREEPKIEASEIADQTLDEVRGGASAAQSSTSSQPQARQPVVRKRTGFSIDLIQP